MKDFTPEDSCAALCRGCKNKVSVRDAEIWLEVDSDDLIYAMAGEDSVNGQKREVA